MSARAGHIWTVLPAAALVVLLSVGGGAWAQEPTLSLTLHVSAPAGAGTVGAELVAGIAAGAGTGFDPGLDGGAFRVGALRAWFFDASRPLRAQELGRDYRGGAVEEVWTLKVATPGADLGTTVNAGSPVTLTWDPPATASGLCGDRSLTLVDVDGGGYALDMASETAYTVPAPGADGVYTLQLVVGAAGSASEAAPAPPSRLFSPVQGRRGVLLVWSPAQGSVAGYHVERTDQPGDPAAAFVRLTGSAVREARYMDADVVGQGVVGYRVVAVSGSGCESAPSATLIVRP